MDWLAAPTSYQSAIKQTVFAANPSGASTTVYAHLNRSAVYLLLKQGNQLLQLHVECVLTRGSVAELKEELQRVVQAILDAGVNSSQKVNTIGIAIYAESNRITQGRYETFWGTMYKRFRDTIIGDVLLALVPALAGVYFGLELKQAGIAVISASIAVFIWVAIEAVERQKVIVYEDV